jgi:hypothetical protein
MSANESKLATWRPEQEGTDGATRRQTNGEVMGGDSPLSRAIRQDVAHYIEQMASELSSMARQSNFDLLAYFLDMTRQEAHAVVRRFDEALARSK